MDINITQDICPITDFKNNSAKLLNQVRETKNPLLITQRGKTVAVLIDAEEYQKHYEKLEILSAILKGKKDIKEKKFYAHEDVMKELDEWLK